MSYVTSLFARKMVAAAGDAVDGAALLRAAGVDPDGAWDPAVMIPDDAYYALVERIAAQTDVTDLPVRVGASMRCDDYGALGLAWKAARDLRGGLMRVGRYARLWTGVVGYTLQPDPRGALYVVHRAGDRRLGLRLSTETTLVATIALAREVSMAPVTALEIQIRHPAPAATAAHERWFGCPVRFDAACDAILFSADTLAQPNRLGDDGISGFLTAHLDRELSAIGDEAPLIRQTRDAIAQALSDGTPAMGEIARSLGLSARSLHRRLSAHGVSFQSLAEEARRALAEALLREDRHSLAEIAFLTGFSEQSAFTRAFRRWVGVTPASYRKAQRTA